MGRHSRDEGAKGTEEQNASRVTDMFRGSKHDATHRAEDSTELREANRQSNAERGSKHSR